MKRTIGAVMMVLTLLLSMGVAPAMAHTEDEPMVIPLLAGQDMKVGEVSVWNNGDDLCVKYALSVDALEQGWLLYETHLAVAPDVESIPQTKPRRGEVYGSPIPGQFAYGHDGLDGVSEWQVCMPLEELDVEIGDALVIAAHAVVKKVDDFSETLVSESGVGTVQLFLEDPQNPGWPMATGSEPVPPVETWKHPSWPMITASSAVYISTAEYAEDLPYSANSWRLFVRDFELPLGAINIAGTLRVNSDNAEVVELNTGEWPDGTVYGVDSNSYEWKTVQSYDVGSVLMPGANVMEVMVRNYDGTNSATGNPTGLIYDLAYEYQVVTSESAWAAGTRFVSKGNWATYFTYTVQHGCAEVETLTVPSDGTAVMSSALEDGASYRFVASGTFTYNSAGDWADAEWYLKSGEIVKGDTEGSKSYVLDLSIDGYSVNRDWGEYNPDHVYEVEWTGTGVPVTFSIYDSAHSDNEGTLSVTIYRCW